MTPARALRGPWRRAALVVTAGCFGFGLWLRLGPLPEELLDQRASLSTVVVDRRGLPLYEALSGDATRSVHLTADQLPPVLVAATLAAEDRRFWSHPGVDPLAVLRALKINLVERRVVEGGSTISQQVAKLLLSRQGRHRGLIEKAREAVIALRLEHRFSKGELLALYLNHAAYGNQIVGVERASRAYFGTSAPMLTAAQAAFLAGLPQRPSRFNPYRHRELAVSRQRTVIRRMERAGALSPEQANEAREERLTFTHLPSPFIAPHFVEMVLASAGNPRPARITTTLDRALQADVSGVIDSHRARLRAHGARNVAVVVLDNLTGEWLAWEGSGDYADTANGGAINGPVIPRQPGSALKPFTYALAFEEGRSPATVLADVPSHFPTAEPGVVYSPRNYDGHFRGPLLARRALAESQNVPAVALASDIGVPTLLRFLSRAGLTTFEKNAAYYGLGMTLGNAEVRLDELVAAYSSFARGGVWIPPTHLLRSAHAPDATSASLRTVVSPRTAFWISDILSDGDAREYVFGRGGSLEFPFPVAVKTGTSQAYHDNWTIGYSRDVTVGVWVGNFDRTPLRSSSGVTGAAPIFHAVMLAAERRFGGAATALSTDPILATPPDVEPAEICALSGMAANAWCPSRRREWLASEAVRLPCSWHHHSDDGPLLIWPPEYREWAATHGFGGPGPTNSLPSPTQALRATSVPLRITSPPSGATYLIDPTLDREFQALALKVVASQVGRIEWIIDGAEAGSAHSDEAFMWPLVPGPHRIAARDANGRTAETTIVVR